MKNMLAKAITCFDHENTCWERKRAVLAIEICVCPWKFCTLPMKICFDNIVRSRPPYIPKRTILSNQNLWAKLYFCIRKPRVHGQNFIFIACLHLQTAFSWSKLLLCMGKLMLVFTNVFSWAIFVFAFADIFMSMPKRHFLILASFFMCT